MSHSQALATTRPTRHAKRLFLGGLVVAIAGAMTLPALAQGPGGHGMGPGHHQGMGAMMDSPRRLDRMLDSVQATDAQRAQIRPLVEAAAPELRALRETGRTLRSQMRQLMTAPTIDTNAVEQMRLKTMEHAGQVSARMTRLMVDVAQQLTPEQRTKVAERMAKRGEHRGGRMQRGEPRS